MATWKFCRY